MLRAINSFPNMDNTWVQWGFSVTMLRTCPPDKLGYSSFLPNEVRRKYDEEGILCLDASKDDDNRLKGR